MTRNEVVIEGTIQPDGTLVLDEPTKLPAGRVQVLVQSLPGLPPNEIIARRSGQHIPLLH